ncbi:MAG: DUF1476 domain-containing protein [Pseudomonadota bacterium]
MSDFDKRKKAFEAKFKQDADAEFKINAKRNALLAKWLANQIGLSDEKKYAKLIDDVIQSDLEKPGIDDVVNFVMQKIKENQLDLSEYLVRRKIEQLDQELRQS